MNSENMISIRKAAFVWAALVLLTLAGALVAEKWQVGPSLVLLAVGMLVLKGQMIVDHFMGLRPVRWLWRGLMSAYSVVIGAFIIVAYLWS